MVLDVFGIGAGARRRPGQTGQERLEPRRGRTVAVRRLTQLDEEATYLVELAVLILCIHRVCALS